MEPRQATTAMAGLADHPQRPRAAAAVELQSKLAAASIE
jgi:hypothetical protein